MQFFIAKDGSLLHSGCGGKMSITHIYSSTLVKCVKCGLGVHGSPVLLNVEGREMNYTEGVPF